MKPGRWVCSGGCEPAWRAAALALLLVTWLGAAFAVAIEPPQARALVGDDATPPAGDDPRWTTTTLPDARASDVVWYRTEFDHPQGGGSGLWMLYLPCFYGGGRVWLNGELVASVLESGAGRRVRWERPMLLPLPLPVLRDGVNVLHLRAVRAHMPSATGLPRLVVGTQDDLQPQFERRLFVVRTMPMVTVLGGSVVGAFVIYIWLRRRSEILCGLFGVAALPWALRTATFVIDTLPAWLWPWWRLMYHATTGGFIVLMSLFALKLAGWYRPWIALALGAYWLLGPLAYLLAGAHAEVLVGRWWVAGLIPVGLSIVVFTAIAAVRERTVANVAIFVAVTVGVIAGIHDYIVAWRAPWLQALLPDWSDHRIFLMHYGANLLLIVMGAVLTVRFVRSLDDAEQAKATLAARVAEREREVVASYERIAALQRERATVEERQRIMQDLHDGLGSQLFTSLSRAALGNFLFRWEGRLRDAGVVPTWQIDVPDAVLAIAPHDTLQILRVLQEALTNVLKHSQATRVRVSLSQGETGLRLQVDDDGRGLPAGGAHAGRGHANMRVRAQRLGACLEIVSAARGARVALDLPLPATRAAG